MSVQEYKDQINTYIKENNKREITGNKLNSVLIAGANELQAIESQVNNLEAEIIGSISPDTTLIDLNDLSNGRYSAERSGTYQFSPALQIVDGEVVNVVPEGYDVKFLKDASGWRVASVVKMPTIPVDGVVEDGNTEAVSGGEVYDKIKLLEDKIETQVSQEYDSVLTYRAYSSNNDYVTTLAEVSQVNNSDYDELDYNVSSGAIAVYFNTPVIVKDDSKYIIEGTYIQSNGGTSTTLGVGFGRNEYYLSIVYRSTGSAGDIIYLSPYGATVLETGLPVLNENDVIKFEISVNGTDVSDQSITIYLNGSQVATVNPLFPILIDSNINLVLRGGLKASFKKIAEITPNFALKSEVDNIISVINPVHPFKRDATFTRGSISYEWLKTFLIDIKMFGFPVEDRISLFLVRRNSSANPNKYQMEFYRDLGDGSGNSATRELVLSWSDPTYVEPTGITSITHTQGDKGFKAYVDWSAIPDGESIGTINYNAAGFAQEVYINFNTSNIVPQPAGDVRLLWQYNDVDAPVTGTDLYQQFTVLENVDEGDEKIANTGATYNHNTKEYVIARFARGRASRLLFYKRSDLVDYSPTGTIVPVPTRVIDISNYINNIQGICYDGDLDCYWCLGSLNALGADDERILIAVDDEGYLLDTYLLPYVFAPGMIVMSPDNQNLLIKQGNGSRLWEINKRTKALVRNVFLYPYEGIAIDPVGEFVWFAGDDGVLKKTNYSDFSEVYTKTFATLPDVDEVSQNVEGIIYDPIDGALLFVADAYYHGAHNNGNCMWVFDFEKTIKKSLRFPEMFRINQENVSQIFDFNGYESTINNVDVLNGDVTVQYRGSNTAPTFPLVQRENWRDIPFYEQWGDTVPSEWDDVIPSFRYIQIKVVYN